VEGREGAGRAQDPAAVAGRDQEEAAAEVAAVGPDSVEAGAAEADSPDRTPGVVVDGTPMGG
jgi:hypothetical protein